LRQPSVSDVFDNTAMQLDAAVFGRSKSISEPNFVDISQFFVAEI